MSLHLRSAAAARFWQFLRLFLTWYVSAWAGLHLLIIGMLLAEGWTLRRILSAMPRIVTFTSGNYANWFVLPVPFLLFLLTRSLVRTYRKSGFRAFLAALGLRGVLPLSLLVASYQALDWYRTDRTPYAWDHSVENPLQRVRGLYEVDGKQRGVTFFARDRVEAEQLLPLLRNNVEWITLVPYGFQEEPTRPELRFGTEPFGSWGRTDSGIAQTAALARKHGMRLMLKPQVWLERHGRGVWLPDIRQTSEQDWKQWFHNYGAFIRHYAQLAARLRADAFCIGTELHGTAKERPGDWRALIGDIRRIYHGKLTYAANWTGELEDVTFWDALDYIGVQGYFPLTDKSEPALQDCIDGWQRHVFLLENTSRRYRKPVLFTEIGYKSTPDAAIRPWEWPQHSSGFFKRASGHTQANCYEAFFQVLWHKEWFVGAHVWRWYADHDSVGGRKSIDFTPQNKPAENVIARGYGRLTNGVTP